MNTPISDPSDNDGQLIYIYMGLWAGSGSNLAASALQWGEADIGGTVIGSNSEWTYTQWVVTASYGAFYYGEQPVGDGEIGVAGDQGVDGYGYFYASGCLVDGYGNCLADTYYELDFYPDSDMGTATQAVAGVVEAFGITQCGDFPGSFASTSPQYAYDTDDNYIDIDWETCAVYSGGGCGVSSPYSGPNCGFAAYNAEIGTQYNMDFND
jgi:hypothetical protein